LLIVNRMSKGDHVGARLLIVNRMSKGDHQNKMIYYYSLDVLVK